MYLLTEGDIPLLLPMKPFPLPFPPPPPRYNPLPVLFERVYLGVGPPMKGFDCEDSWFPPSMGVERLEMIGD